MALESKCYKCGATAPGGLRCRDCLDKDIGAARELRLRLLLIDALAALEAMQRRHGVMITILPRIREELGQDSCPHLRHSYASATHFVCDDCGFRNRDDADD